VSGAGDFNGATGTGTLTYVNNAAQISSTNFDPNGPSVGLTPELDSLALFGAGALGLAGYGLTWRRARRKSASN
jgi:hypothetical protein